ncbi:hypothetical protein MLA01_27050 [Microbacterium lacticum]|nr:hypothetical protein MLA01_27050 [Microbacterium lacticum]
MLQAVFRDPVTDVTVFLKPKQLKEKSLLRAEELFWRSVTGCSARIAGIPISSMLWQVWRSFVSVTEKGKKRDLIGAVAGCDRLRGFGNKIAPLRSQALRLSGGATPLPIVAVLI